jgi:hypothetical protein
MSVETFGYTPLDETGLGKFKLKKAFKKITRGIKKVVKAPIKLIKKTAPHKVLRKKKRVSKAPARRRLSPQPIYNEPVYNEPVYNEPSYDEPSYDEPSYDEPSYDEPVYTDPSYDEPVDETYSDTGGEYEPFTGGDDVDAYDDGLGFAWFAAAANAIGKGVKKLKKSKSVKKAKARLKADITNKLIQDKRALQLRQQNTMRYNNQSPQKNIVILSAVGLAVVGLALLMKRK